MSAFTSIFRRSMRSNPTPASFEYCASGHQKSAGNNDRCAYFSHRLTSIAQKIRLYGQICWQNPHKSIQDVGRQSDLTPYPGLKHINCIMAIAQLFRRKAPATGNTAKFKRALTCRSTTAAHKIRVKENRISPQQGRRQPHQ